MKRIVGSANCASNRANTSWAFLELFFSLIDLRRYNDLMHIMYLFIEHLI